MNTIPVTPSRTLSPSEGVQRIPAPGEIRPHQILNFNSLYREELKKRREPEEEKEDENDRERVLFDEQVNRMLILSEFERLQNLQPGQNLRLHLRIKEMRKKALASRGYWFSRLPVKSSLSVLSLLSDQYRLVRDHYRDPAGSVYTGVL